jgi:cytochrome c peroxidase
MLALPGTKQSLAQGAGTDAPPLRGVADRPPSTHAGQFATLIEALAHDNRASAAPRGHSEIHPLGLSDEEIGQLLAFPGALSDPRSTTLAAAPTIPPR